MVLQPKIFKTVVATASGNTAVWTPASKKRFRVLKYSIQITANASISGGGLLEVVLNDGSTAIGMGFSSFCPAVAGTTFSSTCGTGWIDIGDGYVSKFADNVLNINLSAALTSGEIRVNVAGIEQL